MSASSSGCLAESMAKNPLRSNMYPTLPGTPTVALARSKIFLISPLERLRLSVSTSTSTATPPGPYPSYMISSKLDPSRSPVPRLMARSMFSLGMETERALSMA